MSAYDKLFKIAESQGITVPEVIKFLASPAGYTLSKILSEVETRSNLPQGILALAQNPSSGVTDYLKTQANNAIYNENEPSKVERIISELQGQNQNNPDYVGPQEEDSPLSQLNASMFSQDIGVQPSDIASVNPSNFNDELRSGLYGTITPNFPNFVGPQEENSPANQIGMQFLAEDLGIKPTSTTSNTSGGSTLPALTPEFLQSIMAPPSGVNPDRDAVKEFQGDMSPAFGNATPESLGFTEATADYGDRYFGGGGGGGKFMSSEYAKGGQIYRGIR